VRHRAARETEPLSEREREVLALIALGHTNAEVAEKLVLSVRTVEAHRARIQEKLGISGRAHLLRYAREHGLIDT
jgi:DNA-binding CsgD family transcriptional regulator